MLLRLVTGPNSFKIQRKERALKIKGSDIEPLAANYMYQKVFHIMHLYQNFVLTLPYGAFHHRNWVCAEDMLFSKPSGVELSLLIHLGKKKKKCCQCVSVRQLFCFDLNHLFCISFASNV